MRNPTICGRNRINMPTSGCGSCDALTEEEIIALTPIECYEAPCSDSRVCYGQTCCMIVGCNGGDEPLVCDAKVCESKIGECK